jgi:hypothetical protein
MWAVGCPAAQMYRAAFHFTATFFHPTGLSKFRFHSHAYRSLPLDLNVALGSNYDVGST